jgi:hypothetical protein
MKKAQCVQYSKDRKVFLDACLKAREIISRSRSGSEIRTAEIDLRYSQDALVYLRGRKS